MDLEELRHHAKRHSQWTMHLSVTQTLICRYRHPGGIFSGWHFVYWLKDPIGERQITEERANRLINAAFERAMA